MQVASPGDVQDETIAACVSIWRRCKEKLLDSLTVREDGHNTGSEGQLGKDDQIH